MIESYETVAPLQLLLQSITRPSLIVLLAIVLGFGIERVLLAWLVRLSKHVAWKTGEVVIKAVQGGVTTLWGFLLGSSIAIHTIRLSSTTSQLITRILFIFFVLSLIIASSRLILGLIYRDDQDEKQNNSVGQTPSILNNIIRIVLFVVGSLIILQTVGIEITPLLAAFGVGGIAISLALQHTLENLFSGIQITLAGRVRPGDYIKLSSGEEGYVTDINWNHMQIRQLANNMVIIPNSHITSAILVNYNAPESELSVLFDVGVSYDSDLKTVERVTVEVAQEVMQYVDGGVPTHEPFIRYNAFNDSSIHFTVVLRGKEFVNQYILKHEFIKRLHHRYQQEGIVIPYPIRTVYMHTP